MCWPRPESVFTIALIDFRLNETPLHKFEKVPVKFSHTRSWLKLDCTKVAGFSDTFEEFSARFGLTFAFVERFR
jgi:hypothetical protein